MFNPDLFWHLTTGHWILTHWSIPRADFMTFTKSGTPWVDYEWLTETIYQALYILGGFQALWLSKILLLWGSWACLNDVLKVQGVGTSARIAALNLWAAAIFPQTDIRPDLFSIFFFCLLAAFLERRRKGFSEFTPAKFVALGFLFALWANLHPGFFVGWLLLAAYALEDGIKKRWQGLKNHLSALLIGILTTLINPYGIGMHKTIVGHWRLTALLTQYISEWKPLYEAGMAGYWVFWGGLALFVLAFSRMIWSKPSVFKAPALVGVAAIFGVQTIAHRRMLAFADSAAIMILPSAVIAAWDVSADRVRRLYTILIAALIPLSLYEVMIAASLSWRGPFDAKPFPTGAVHFMENNSEIVRPLRVYTPWGWGGYLIWKLAPWYRAYWGSRVLLHAELISELSQARSDPRRWREDMDKDRLDAALTRSDSLMETITPLNAENLLARRKPWFLPYFPVNRWALVYWDKESLFFTRRDRVPKQWLSAHEYRCFWPPGALAPTPRAPVTPPCLREERLRHERETQGAPDCRWLGRCLAN